MNTKDNNIWKHVTGKKKGSYGETDFNKKVITINKNYHKSKGNHGSGVKKNKDGSASILDTIVHEELHKRNPNMLERTVRKLTPKKVKKMSKKIKNKLYSKYK